MDRVPAVVVDRIRDGMATITVGVADAGLVRPILENLVRLVESRQRKVVDGHEETEEAELEEGDQGGDARK